MDINEVINALTEGLDDTTAAVIRKAIERDAVKTKAQGWKAEKEYQSIMDRQNQIQLELEGDAATGKLGAKAYKDWYDKNFPAVQKLQADMAKYQEKYGAIDAPTPTPGTPPASGARTYTPEEIRVMIQEEAKKQFLNEHAPHMSSVVLTTGKIMQKHLLAGRKNEVDFANLAKIANEKYAGNLDLAYDEWDKPEREKLAKVSEEERVNKRVADELAKRGATSSFPSAADFSPSSLSTRTKDTVDKFDKTQLLHDLARDWNNPGSAS